MTHCPHCTGQHDHGALFCPTTGKAISVSRIQQGTLVDGKYRIVRRVASGGMGAVYEVMHERIRRKMAMKFILPELAASEEVSQRFEIEARAASAIGHENIVEVTDMGTTSDGLPFLVMEFLEGFDLAALLEDGPVEQGRTVRIVSQVLAALEAAHGRQIIHRDLKPENVFLIERGEDPDFVKLLDFGISKFAGGEEAKLHLTSTGLILGTPYYMSPEQARGERELDQRSDLFSVGVILYQLLTGKRPFAADNLNQLLYQITSGQVTKPRELNPEIDASLERVVLKALAHEAKHRFQSASEFRSALLGEKLSTREMPPARVSTDHLKVPGAFQPTLANGTDADIDPAAKGTPLAWTGERTQRTSSNRGLLWAGLAGLMVVVAVVTVLIIKYQTRPNERGASAAAPAAMDAAPMGATMAPQVMRIPTETVRLTLKLDPTDARVSLDGKVVTSTPIVLQRAVTSHRLKVEAEGYVAQELKVTATSDQTLVINLKARPKVTAQRRRRRHRRTMRAGMTSAMRPTMRPRPVGMKQIRAITDI